MQDAGSSEDDLRQIHFHVKLASGGIKSGGSPKTLIRIVSKFEDQVRVQKLKVVKPD
ncbi:MAG: hypothetical protein IPP89_12900 [Saprospiraceae bacterium]|nr:hypothetical protein [Candidatus Brachybacter algidus]MBL0119847.1 hypothetical protein [Candidatus Brachybacter algidus]